MSLPFLPAALVAFLATAAAGADAASLTYAGSLEDGSNAALIVNDQTDVTTQANNVALYSITIPIAEMVTFSSAGYSVDGMGNLTGNIDPYFTLFSGADNSATFVDSNVLSAQSTGGDFVVSDFLSAGTYQFSIGVNQNMSLAENQGHGTLGDGFTGLGFSGYLGNGNYQITLTAAAVPEASSWVMLLGGLAMLGVAGSQRTARARA